MQNDNQLLNLSELAVAMNVSRVTVSRWRVAGYEPEFGYKTSVGHCKHWLRTVWAPYVRAQKAERRAELKARLAKLS